MLRKAGLDGAGLVFTVALALAVGLAAQAASPGGPFGSASRHLPAEALARGYDCYRVLGVDQAGAERLFAGAEAAVYYPVRGEVLLVTHDEMRADAERWFARQEGGAGRSPWAGADRMGTVALGDFFERARLEATCRQESSPEPFLCKFPAEAEGGISAGGAAPAFAPPVSQPGAVFLEGFEGDPWSRWTRSDNSGGQYGWGTTECEAYADSRCADGSRGGTLGSNLACSDSFPPGLRASFQDSLCEDFYGASEAWLSAYFQIDSPPSDSDTALMFYYEVPTVPPLLRGYGFGGNWAPWYHLVYNLRGWSGYDLTTVACNRLKIGWETPADPAACVGPGGRVDDIGVFVAPPPGISCWAVASPPGGHAPLTVTYSGEAAGMTATPEYGWFFSPDFGGASGPTVTRTYSSPGSYQASFSVSERTTHERCRTDVRVIVGCYLVCQAGADPTAGPAPLTVQFYSIVDSLYCSDSPSFLWDFGDGNSSTEANPLHAYAEPGTYRWKLTVLQDGSACTRSGTVIVQAPSASVQGTVGVAAGNAFYPLDGASLTGTADLRTPDDALVASSPIAQGAFSFPGVSPGDYTLEVRLQYADHILGDAQLQTYGCGAPGIVTKEVSSPSIPVSLQEGPNAVAVEFPPPLVFLHGALGCYGQWLDGANGGLWDNTARSMGFITFTPNYPTRWWGDGFGWEDRADAVLEQIGQDLGGLGTAASTGPVPYHMIAFEMGGLVARVLTSGAHRADSAVEAIERIFLLGVPNSGSELLLGGSEEPLGTDTVVRRFNRRFPDFGDKTQGVYAIGGTEGLWGDPTDDGRVPVYSAFNIAAETCGSQGGNATRCLRYPLQAFDSGPGHLFGRGHAQLPGPSSVQDIFAGTIVPVLSSARERGIPDSPGGGIIWGTLGRTTGTASGTVQARRASGGAGSYEVAFPVSDVDAIGFVALATQGSGKFELLDPSGNIAHTADLPEQPETEANPGLEFVRYLPAPGNWVLKVTPLANLVSFSARMVEKSPFGIWGYLSGETASPGETLLARTDPDGEATSAVFSSVTATLKDAAGEVLQAFSLFDDGQHQDGAAGDGSYGASFAAPPTPGSYSVMFLAAGSYRDLPFHRAAFASLQVLPPAHWFTGAFSDRPLDTDGDGKSDAIALSCGVTPPSNTFLLSGELYDAGGFFVARASSNFRPSGGARLPVDLVFPVGQAFCPQIGAFTARNLQISDGATLAILDAWPDPVATAAYDPSGFNCRPGAPGPVPAASRPDQGSPGRFMSLLVAGRNFRTGATLSLGAGVEVLGVTVLDSDLLEAALHISPDAALGLRDLTVADVGGASGALAGAFEVMADEPPSAAIRAPAEGQEVAGRVGVWASASDDFRVTEVALAVDGVVQGRVSEAPYLFEWDTRGLSNGAHILTAVAKDDAGQTGTGPAVGVAVNNPPVPGDCDGDRQISIGEVQRAINMFLGTQAPSCGVDCDGGGTVSIGELQRVITGFLGAMISC